MDDVELEEELLGGCDSDAGMVVQSLTVEEEELLLAGDDDDFEFGSKGHDREWRSERRESDRSPVTFKQEVTSSSGRYVKERLGPLPATVTVKQEPSEAGVSAASASPVSASASASASGRSPVTDDVTPRLTVKREIEDDEDEEEDEEAHKHSKRSKFHSERVSEVSTFDYVTYANIGLLTALTFSYL